MSSLIRFSFIIMLIIKILVAYAANPLDDIQIITSLEITDGSSKLRKVKLTNNCHFDIYVAICWHDPGNNDWRCACWGAFDGNSSDYLLIEGSYLTTDYSYAYFYAKTLYGSYV